MTFYATPTVAPIAAPVAAPPARAEIAHGRLALIAGRDVTQQLPLLTPNFTRDRSADTEQAAGYTCPLTWTAVTQLATLCGSSLSYGPDLAAWIAREVAARTANTDAPLSYRVPRGLTPYWWQTRAANIIANCGHALLGDSPGTGKTASATLGLAELFTRGAEPLPALVVCPASVVDPWCTELQRWFPAARTIAWRGTRRRREHLPGRAHVYVMSYDLLRFDADLLRTLAPRFVALDEHHYIARSTAQRTQVARAVAARAAYVVALSGTSILRDVGDLHPTLSALDPGGFPSQERYLNRYTIQVPGDYGTNIIGFNRQTEPEFRTCLLGWQRRIAKEDVLTELPSKVYNTRTVELPAKYRKEYNAMEKDMAAQLGENGADVTVMHVFTMMTVLRQLATAPCEVSIEWRYDENTGLDKPHYHTSLFTPSWKIGVMLDILREREKPSVVFAPSAQLVALAGKATHDAGYRTGFVIGGQTARERTSTIQAFQAGHLDVLCATTGAGGTGVEFTAADCAIFLQRPWGMEALQSEDRLHRIGSEQHEAIDIFDIVAKNTIESRIRDRLHDCTGQLADFLQDPRIVQQLFGGSRA